MSASPQKLEDWLDKEEVAKDDITAFPLKAMAATLDREENGDSVPPLWHWLYFLPVAPMSEVGQDGHPKRGGFLPPVPLPRRMWAGGRLTFHAPLKVGERATRTSTIADIEDKTGRSRPSRVRHGAAHHRSRWRTEARRRARHRLSRRAAGGRAAAAAATCAGRRNLAPHDRRRRCHAVPLFGADFQRPPHPLRLSVRHARSKAIQAWSCTVR